jgi:hypothetical protein
MKNDYKPLALVVGGSLIASIISFLLGLKYLYAAILIVIVGLSFAYGLGMLQASLKKYRKCHRWRKIRIGILNDIDWNDEEKDGGNKERNDKGPHVGTVVTPDEWIEKLKEFLKVERLNSKVEYTKVTSKFEEYSAILNPYGSVYPETDLSNLETLHKILEYVNEGGLFINVADMPFYYAYNNRIKKIVVQQQPGFLLNTSAEYGDYKPNPFTKEVGLQIVNLDVDGTPTLLPLKTPEGGYIEVVCRRGAVVGGNVIEHLLTHIKRTNRSKNNDESIKAAPVFSIRYGEGEFLISTIWMFHDENEGEKREVILRTMFELIFIYLKNVRENANIKNPGNSKSTLQKH